MTTFDETTLRKLDQLTLVADRIRAGQLQGDRRSTKRGSSIEFADYRDYAKGDDLRRLDWNVYARLERPFIKLLEEEEDLAVHVLVDSSASMDWPEEGDRHKHRYALRLAAALGHIALSAGDQLNALLLQSGGDRVWGPFRGGANSLRLFQFLDSAETGGITDLNLSLRNYALRGRRPGLLFLISDLLSPDGVKSGLNALQSRGYEVGILHLLSPDEIDPGLAGDLKLVDIETDSEAEITLDPPTLAEYRQRVADWQQELAGYCLGRGVHYIPVTTDQPWEKLILQTLRARGVVK